MIERLQRGHVPAGLATGQLDNASAEQLATFLADVARVRKLALSVPTAFNALVFGYAQQLLTGLIDKHALSLLSNVPSKDPAQDRLPSHAGPR